VALIELIAGAMVTTGASLILIGVIGLWLTRRKERERATQPKQAAERGTTSSDPTLRVGPPSPASALAPGEGLGRTTMRGDNHECEDQ